MISPPSYVQVQKNLEKFPKVFDQEQPPSYEIATRKAVYQYTKLEIINKFRSKKLTFM